jgi:signal recognition particle GTPase
MQDVNRLIKQYLEARKMMKMLSGRGDRQWLGRSARTFS